MTAATAWREKRPCTAMGTSGMEQSRSVSVGLCYICEYLCIYVRNFAVTHVYAHQIGGNKYIIIASDYLILVC